MAHNDALQKRLTAVYDSFDQRSYKGAIKLCNAGLQKYPDCWTFKSLKAVALERSGKRDEALQVAQEVLAAAPPDDHVLNMLLLVLKPARRAADVLSAYEAACSKQPNNEELLQGLFACHVRSSSYPAQQQVAMKLNKLHPSELYQWWVVASLALQAHTAAVQARLSTTAAADASSTSSSTNSTSSSNGQPAAAAAVGLGADKLLALAEAMAARLLGKGGQHSWESVMMYLGLLQAQGKYDTAIAAVRGPLGASFSLSAERREAEAALLHAKGDLQAAAQLYQQALQEQPDDWAVLLLYLDCMLPGTASTLPACGLTAVAQMVTGVEASTQPGCQAGGLAALMAAVRVGDQDDKGSSLQEQVAKAAAVISSLSSPEGSAGPAVASAAVLRGPALAHVELAKRQLQLGLSDEQQLVEALLLYHDRFGHVVSCAMDVFCYMGLLGSSSRQQLSSSLALRAEQAAAEFKQQQQEQQQGSSNKALLHLLRRQMSARQIQSDLGAPSFSTPAAAAQHAQQLLQLYAAALPLYQGLDERERGPADELLWQAAAALVAAAQLQQHTPATTTDTNSSSNSSSASIGYLIQAVLVLEAAVKGRPYCAPVRLGLTGLYGLLGDAAAAAQHFGGLDVKHVQHDTLSSHHLLPLLLGLRAGVQSEGLVGSMCALFEDHLEDAGDTLMQAYKNGTHTKVLEFVCFKERLERSHSFVLARAERALLSITTAAAGSGQQAGASAAAAVAAAVQALPLEQLDSIDWRGMRFNDDLTTRLPWLPPIQGPRQLVVLSWWEQQQQGMGSHSTGSSSGSNGGSSSSAACWWRQVSAAEADLPAAAALRDATKAAAQQRWLLPHLLHAALGACSSNITSSSTQQLPQLLERLAAAQGYSSASELDRAVQSTFGDGLQAGSSGQVLSQQMQLLDAAVFTLAHSLQEHMAASQEPDAANGHVAATAAGAAGAAGDVPRCTARLSAGLSRLQQYLQQQLQPSAACKGCVLPGHVLSAAALLLGESCCWLELCLESWNKVLKHGKKKKGGKAAAADQPSPQAESAAHALGQLQQSLLALLHELQEGAQRLLQGPADAAAASLLAEFDESSNAAVRALVGWEPRMSVQLVLLDLVKQQRGLLTQIKDSSGKMRIRLQGVHW